MEGGPGSGSTVYRTGGWIGSCLCILLADIFYFLGGTIIGSSSLKKLPRSDAEE